MDLRVANIFILAQLLARRLLKRFLILAFCLIFVSCLFFAISHFGSPLNQHENVNPQFGVGRVSSTLSKSKLIANKGEIFLVACILSAPSNTRERQAARESWLSLRRGSLADDVAPLFILGGEGLDGETSRALGHEMDAHHDLLILDNVVDSYANLTLKLLHAYTWIDAHLQPRYVLKMDDDSFARVDVIIGELSDSLSHHPRLYWGFFDGRARPFKKGKWSEKSWNLCDLYLPYALGGGYVVSGNLVAYVARNAGDLRLFFNEDVAMGTWMAPLDVYRKHDPRFDTEYKSRGCFSSYLVTHKQTAEMLKTKYDNLLRTESICGGSHLEYRARMSYDYNWTVPPSQCCHRGNSNLP